MTMYFYTNRKIVIFGLSILNYLLFPWH